MRAVGAFDAKTHFSALLADVERGEEVVITRHGKAVARLVPAGAGQGRTAAKAAAARILAGNAQAKLDGLSLKELIAEGRK